MTSDELPPTTKAPPRRDAALIANQRKRRAKEWKEFRKNFLYSQFDLAEALGCSRRTVGKVEAGVCTPLPRFQRRFRDLVRQEEERVA
jgi:DNA-binding XRE family transcriptional regulator